MIAIIYFNPKYVEIGGLSVQEGLLKKHYDNVILFPHLKEDTPPIHVTVLNSNDDFQRAAFSVQGITGSHN